MKNDGIDRLVELLEKALMIHLYSMGIPQNDIARALSKRAEDVNAFLKPLAKRKH